MSSWAKRLRLGDLSDKHFSDLLRGSVIVLMARVLGVVLGFATSMIVARWFGAGATGLMALLNSIALVFGTVSAFGLGELLMRDLSAKDEKVDSIRRKHFFYKALGIVLLIASILLVPTVALIYTRLPDFAADATGLLLFVVAMLLGRALLMFMDKISRAVSSAAVYALFLILPIAINFIVVAAFTLLGDHIPVVPSIALSLSVAVSTLSLLLFIVRRLTMCAHSHVAVPVSSLPEEKLPEITLLLRSGAPFAVSAVLGMVVMEGNIVVAGLLLPIEQVGIYSIAYKVSMFASFFLTTVNMIAAPRFSRLYAAGDMKQLRSYSKHATSIIFWLSLPVILVFVFAGEWLISIGFGPQFHAADPALSILMIGQAVNAYTGVSNIFLNMTMGEKQLARIISVAAITNILLSFVLAPKLGINGLAIAMAVSLSIWNLAAAVVIRLRNGYWLCWVPRHIFRYGAER